VFPRPAGSSPVAACRLLLQRPGPATWCSSRLGESWIARSQISRRCKPPSAGKTPETGAVPCVGITLLLAQPSGHRAMPSEGIQGDELAAYVPLDTYNKGERGIAYGTRVLRRRRPRSSRRRHDLPRRAGKPSTGRRGPGDRTTTTERYAQCRAPKRCWMSCVSAAGGACRVPSCCPIGDGIANRPAAGGAEGVV